MGLDHPALVLVDREFQLTGQVTRDTGLDAFPGALASDQNAQVISISRKPVATLFQFFIKVIQENIGEQRREWTTLGCANLRCLDDVPHQHPRPQVTAYQGE